MHIVLVTVGTRGDAQPFVAVGAALARRGHRVTIATHEDHRTLVEGAGLALRPICESMRALLETPEGKRWVDSADNVFEYGKAFRALFEPRNYRWCRDEFDAVHDGDAVVTHLFATGATYGAEKRELPLVVLCPYPSLASGRIAMAPIGELPLIGPWINRSGWRYFERMCWASMAGAGRRVRTEEGLPAHEGTSWDDLRARRTPYVHCYSPTALPRPDDWPEHAEVTGWCTLPPPDGWRPPPPLERFVAGGDALYIGFGSMTGMDQEELARITVGAVRRAGKRAVIGGGWGSWSGIAPGDDLLHVDDVPHEWLLPRVAAVVHHGGSGTLAAGLHAGKPTLVVPFFGDQPLWGRCAHRLGVGPKPLPKKRLDERRLATAITALCSEPAYATRAREVAEQLRAEDGTERTAARVLAHLARPTTSAAS